MKGEKTTKGNPHELTKNQHVIPKESIKRFTASDGKVKISRVASSTSFRGKPDNPVFCVNRVWDQRAENAWMRGIENRYQRIASLCDSRLQLKLIDEQHEMVSRMYLLIWARIRFTINDIKDYKIEGSKMAFSPSKEKMELLESRHITAIDENGVINSRTITGNVMLMKIDQNYKENFQETRWEVIHSNECEFIFSDSYDGYKILPISPNLCFVAREDLYAEPSLRNPEQINEIGKRNSHFYYFQR
jgi:hypothetical protein